MLSQLQNVISVFVYYLLCNTLDDDLDCLILWCKFVDIWDWRSWSWGEFVLAGKWCPLWVVACFECNIHPYYKLLCVLSFVAKEPIATWHWPRRMQATRHRRLPYSTWQATHDSRSTAWLSGFQWLTRRSRTCCPVLRGASTMKVTSIEQTALCQGVKFWGGGGLILPSVD